MSQTDFRSLFIHRTLAIGEVLPQTNYAAAFYAIGREVPSSCAN